MMTEDSFLLGTRFAVHRDEYGQMEGVRKMDKAGLYYWFLVDGIPS